MTARLVIHSEIDSVDDWIETTTMLIKKEAENPFALSRIGQFCIGVAHGLSKAEIESEATEPETKEGEGTS